MRTASSGTLRGRGRGPQHLQPYGDGGRESGGGDDTEDDDGGYDSDTMSVMDSDALREAMGRRERERGGRGALGSVEETVEYVVEFEVSWMDCWGGREVVCRVRGYGMH